MSKSSKRRLAQAAIHNSANSGSNAKTLAAPASAKSLLQAAAQTAASPQRATHIPVGVPLSRAIGTLADVPSLSSSSSALNSQLSTLSSPSPQRAIGLQTDVPLLPSPSSELSNLKSPSGSDSAPPLNSQLSTLNSSSPTQVPSAQCLVPASPPSPFFTEFLEPFCPPQQVDFIELLPIPPDPNHPSAINCQLHDYQAKLKPIFAKLSPDDPNVERINHNYVIVMQIATVERLIASLPGLSEKAMVETNNQIVRMLSIIERTNSRKSREQREKDAATRRIIREQQRKDRQTQKQAEALARNQRTQQREEQRRQREKAKAERAQQKHELVVRKLDLKERDIIARESEQKREHHDSVKPPNTPAAPKPLLPPTAWTCG